MVEAAGVEPASGSGPPRASTRLADPLISRRAPGLAEVLRRQPVCLATGRQAHPVAIPHCDVLTAPSGRRGRGTGCVVFSYAASAKLSLALEFVST